MAKPRRSTQQQFYDLFEDFEVDDQAIVLTFLQELHRLAKRRAAKKSINPPKEELIASQTSLVDAATGKPVTSASGLAADFGHGNQ